MSRSMSSIDSLGGRAAANTTRVEGLACTENRAHVADAERTVAASTSSRLSLEKLGYSWDQTDDIVRIYFPAIASSKNIKCDFTAETCALTAEAEGQRPKVFFFELTPFAGIDPQKCKVHVPRHRRHAVLTLTKQEPSRMWESVRRPAR
mmetsp:Transcript_44268/g.100001  ORF Transcript_44268/g.100001 Transcript_44268/m.100001 type:complete len:149 (+) Transcript_44268:248-694(+)